MKVYLILGLLCVGISAEKKINLDDIERDNLRAESTVKPDNVRLEETKYLKSEINQQQYQTTNRYHPSTVSPLEYVTPSQHHNVHSEPYAQPAKYAVKETTYQQQNSVLQEQTIPLQYYSGYRQHSLPAKAIPSNVYESQQLVYQPEVAVGNQFQTVQQKAVTEKYANNVNKDTIYVDIPMAQLLAYYPNLNINSFRSSGLHGQSQLHQLAASGTEHISIPVYTSALSQKPIVPVKAPYQIQYGQKYSTAVPTTFTTKITKGAVYAAPAASKKFPTSPLLTAPVYLPSDQSYAQGKQLLYTQAYITPQQQQYVPQLVYSQPATVYMHASPVYTDLYARTPAYQQDNSLYGNQKQYSSQQEYAAPADELSKQVLRQQTSQSVAQNYVQVADEPSRHFIPPQLPAQDFKVGVTTLLAIPTQEEESLSVQNHVGLSEPRSLLDSYVPSKLIAARDSSRYRERPIKLEGGFLPSKENFLYKKRKSE